MPLRAGTSVTRPIEFGRYVHARGESFETLQDGTGGWYRTTVNDANRELHLADFGDDKPMQSFRYGLLADASRDVAYQKTDLLLAIYIQWRRCSLSHINLTPEYTKS